MILNYMIACFGFGLNHQSDFPTAYIACAEQVSLAGMVIN